MNLLESSLVSIFAALFGIGIHAMILNANDAFTSTCVSNTCVEPMYEIECVGGTCDTTFIYTIR